MAREEMYFEEFQDGHYRGRPRYQNGITLASHHGASHKVSAKWGGGGGRCEKLTTDRRRANKYSKFFLIRRVDTLYA